jgi:hypothetical protein
MFDRCESVELTFPTQTKLYNIEDILYWFSHCFALDPSELKTIIRSFDFSQHTNITALQALLAKNDNNNGEAEPNNRLTTNDMTKFKANRDIYPTHPNNTVITNLYYGGYDLGSIKYQRLTTDPLGYTPPTP